MPNVIEEIDVSSYSYGWSITRKDGVRLAFAVHDSDIRIEYEIYYANPMSNISDIVMSNELGKDSIELHVLEAKNFINKTDVDEDMWDNAHVDVVIMDWSKQEIVSTIYSGFVSQIRQSYFSSDVKFIIEVSFGTEKNYHDNVYSPLCRNEFGDKTCGHDVYKISKFSKVIGIKSDNKIIVFDDLGVGANWVCRVFLGNNAWYKFKKCNIIQNEIEIIDVPSTDVLVGDVVQVVPMCDKTFAMCTEKYGNAVGFNGEPFVPGEDTLTRYINNV
jgi:uncharacterized phage protein (TIGR02218 family)